MRTLFRVVPNGLLSAAGVMQVACCHPNEGPSRPLAGAEMRSRLRYPAETVAGFGGRACDEARLATYSFGVAPIRVSSQKVGLFFGEVLGARVGGRSDMRDTEPARPCWLAEWEILLSFRCVPDDRISVPDVRTWPANPDLSSGG